MPEPTKQRPGDQPLPVISNRPDIQSMVIDDITARRQVGIDRYGTALQAHNGRDMLRDLYEELLDAATYIRGVIEERDPPEPCHDGHHVPTCAYLVHHAPCDQGRGNG